MEEAQTITTSVSSATGGSRPDRGNDQIFIFACQCDDYFSHYLNDPSNLEKHGSGARDLVEDYNRRFKSWAAYLGVFAGRELSLDRRLRGREEVQDMVVRLLTMLRRNVEFLPSCPAIDHGFNNDKDESTTGSSSDDSDLSYDCGVKADLQDNLLDVLLRGIDESLTELSRIGIIIRQSATTPETIRARNFTARNPDPSAYEMTASIAIESLYPNAPDSLRQQLIQSMVDRQAKVRYRKSRHEKLRFDSRQAVGTAQINDRIDSKPVVNSQGTIRKLFQPLSKSISTSQQGAIGNHHLKSEATTSLNTRLLGQNLAMSQQQKTHLGKKTFSKLVQATEGPPVPKPSEKAGGFECEWCFQMLEPSMIQGGHWTDRGRSHYLADLEPYACIAEECMQELPSFSSASAWLGHMQSTHSSDWANNIHRQAMWRCKYRHDDSEYSTSENYFSTADDLLSHFLLFHPERRISAEEIEQFRPAYLIQDWRQKDTCPLCCYPIEAVDNSGKGYTAPKLENPQPITNRPDQNVIPRKREQDAPGGSRKRTRVTFADTASELQHKQKDGIEHAGMADSDRRIGDDGGQSKKTIASADQALVRHITAHLNNIMLLSVRLMAASKPGIGTEGDDLSSISIESGSGLQDDTDSRMGDLNSITLEDLPFPQDPSSEVRDEESGGEPGRDRDTEWAFVVQSSSLVSPPEELSNNNSTENQGARASLPPIVEVQEDRTDDIVTKAAKRSKSTISSVFTRVLGRKPQSISRTKESEKSRGVSAWNPFRRTRSTRIDSSTMKLEVMEGRRLIERIANPIGPESTNDISVVAEPPTGKLATSKTVPELQVDGVPISDLVTEQSKSSRSWVCHICTRGPVGLNDTDICRECGHVRCDDCDFMAGDDSQYQRLND